MKKVHWMVLSIGVLALLTFGVVLSQGVPTVIDGCDLRNENNNSFIRRVCERLYYPGEVQTPGSLGYDLIQTQVCTEVGATLDECLEYKDFIIRNYTDKSLFIPAKTEKEFLSFKDATKPAGAKVESSSSKKQLARQQGVTFNENTDYFLTENARLYHDPDNGDDGVVICEDGVDCGEVTTIGYCDLHGTSQYDLVCWKAAKDYTGEYGTEYEVEWFKTAPEDWEPYGTLSVNDQHSNFQPPQDPFGSATDVGLLTNGAWADMYTFTTSSGFTQAEYNNSAINLEGRRIRVVKDGIAGPWNYIVADDPDSNFNIGKVEKVGATEASINWTLVANDLTVGPENGQYFQYEVTRCNVTGLPAAQCCISSSGGNCVAEQTIAVVDDAITYSDTVPGREFGDPPSEYIYCVSPLNPAEIVDTNDDPNPLKWDGRPRDCAARLTF